MVPEHFQKIVQKRRCQFCIPEEKILPAIAAHAIHETPIRSSLLSLMQQKPFSRITVTEICRASEITVELFIFIIMIWTMCWTT